MSGYQMLVWPKTGWIAHGALTDDAKSRPVARENGGHLSKDDVITWLDDSGGLVCTCGHASSGYPCHHGSGLLAKVEASNNAIRSTSSVAKRSRSGLQLDVDPWMKALITSFDAHGPTGDQSDGFIISDDYYFPFEGEWGATTVSAADTVFALVQKATSTSGNKVWLPETAMTEIVDLARSMTGLSADTNLAPFIEFANRPEIIRKLPSINGQLDPAQVEAVNWLRDAYDYGIGGILADQMGVGKTLEFLAHLQLLHDDGVFVRALIAVPSAAVDHWMREIRNFTPDLEAIAWEGPARANLKPILHEVDIVVTTHRLMTLDAAILRELNWTVYGFDEAQDGKNPQSELAVASALIPAKQKIPITGTPVENGLLDIHTLSSISLPGLLGRMAHFKTDIAEPVRKGAENADELLDRLYEVLSPFIKHRTQQSAGLAIPAPRFLREDFLLQSDEEAYRNVSEAAKAQLGGDSVSIFQIITRLRQAAADYRLITKNPTSPESTKTAWVADHVVDSISRGKQVLVFSTWTSHLDLLEQAIALRGVRSHEMARYDGAMNRSQKRVSENDFKDGILRALFLTMKAGGRSLNLPEADEVYISIPWWNPFVTMQAAYRPIRRGQTKTIDVWMPVAKDTIEERLMEIQDDKKRISSSILRPAGGSGGLTRAHLMDLIRAS